MVLEKTLTYVRYSLVAVLILYLGIVWLYFKDNASDLTVSSFVLYFLLLPLVLLSAIGALRWYQNKPPAKADSPSSEGTQKDTTPEKPMVRHQLLISGHVLLPEGNEWQQVIDNNDDLTELNRTITDNFGLPILTKPIVDVDSEMASFTEDNAESELSFTQRIKTLIQIQLSAHNASLFSIGEHLSLSTMDDSAIDTASDIHPEWQHTHTLHIQQEDASDIALQPKVSRFELYICLPADADQAHIKAAVVEQMADYDMSEAMLSVQFITAKDSHNEPSTFISHTLCSIAEDSEPRLGMLLVADTQIDQTWLDNDADFHIDNNVVPTEAACALLLANRAASEIVPLADVLPVQLSATVDLSHSEAMRDAPTRSYRQLLPQVKSMLLKQNIIPVAAETAVDDSDAEETTHSLVLISDVDVINHTEALETFMKFTDALSQHQTDAKVHHAGGFMPSNPWLRCFIPICLLTQYGLEHIGTKETPLAIIQHPTCCSLWHVMPIE